MNDLTELIPRPGVRRVFMDWEFMEHGPNVPIIPIAVAMCDELGNSIFAVFEDIQERPVKDQIEAHAWLMKNVMPYLARVSSPGSTFRLDQTSNDVMPRRMVRNLVRDFLLMPETSGMRLELWGWYSSYDHVCLGQLFGKMIDLPAGIPMFTHDLRQRLDEFYDRSESDLEGHGALTHDPREETFAMRTWAQQMDQWERDGERYSLV